MIFCGLSSSDAEINWHQMFHDLIKDFDVMALERRQKKALKAQNLPLPG